MNNYLFSGTEGLGILANAHIFDGIRDNYAPVTVPVGLFMGVPNDLFIASERELAVLNELGSPVDRLHGISDAGVDLVMLCTLEEILTGLNWEAIFDRHYVNPLKDEGPEGPWVYGISKALQEALKDVSSERIAGYAAQWADTDDWTVRDCELQNVVDILSRLIVLARKATDEGKRMFLWTALS